MIGQRVLVLVCLESQFNIGGLAGVAGNLVDAAVTNLTGNRFLGDLSGVAVSNLL